MKIEIKQATRDDERMLNNLSQLYAHGATEFGQDLEVDANGRFPERYVTWDNCWTDKETRRRLDRSLEDHYPFIVKVEQQIAGFALVKYAHSPDMPGVNFGRQYTLQDFFVLRKYRRQGIGKAFAWYLFNRFRGKWEVRHIPRNRIAHNFWGKIISEYTQGEFEEVKGGEAIFHLFNTASLQAKS